MGKVKKCNNNKPVHKKASGVIHKKPGVKALKSAVAAAVGNGSAVTGVTVPLFPESKLFSSGEWNVKPSLNKYRTEDVVTVNTHKKAVKAQYRSTFNKKQRKRLEQQNFQAKIKDLEEQSQRSKKKKKNKIPTLVPIESTEDKDKALPSSDKPVKEVSSAETAMEEAIESATNPSLKKQQNTMEVNMSAFKTVINSSEFKQDPFAAISAHLQANQPQPKPHKPRPHKHDHTKKPRSYKDTPRTNTRIDKPPRNRYKSLANKPLSNTAQESQKLQHLAISSIIKDKASNIKRLSKMKNS